MIISLSSCLVPSSFRRRIFLDFLTWVNLPPDVQQEGNCSISGVIVNLRYLNSEILITFTKCFLSNSLFSLEMHQMSRGSMITCVFKSLSIY